MRDTRLCRFDGARELREPIYLSVVIPAYNESHRLPPYLDRVCRYLGDNFADCQEIVVVDDGSRDDLAAALSRSMPAQAPLRLLRHERNLGKGAAVRTGMKAARGELVLVADADGATPIADERELRRAITAGADIAVGSRLVGSGKVRRRHTGRRILGWLASATIRLVADCGVRDTQCGFKMLRREAAHRLAAETGVDGFAFDVELLRVARGLGYTIAEVPVAWREVPGSTLHLPAAGGRFLFDVLRIRFSDAARRSGPRPEADGAHSTAHRTACRNRSIG